jgi:hypothetical protein
VPGFTLMLPSMLPVMPVVPVMLPGWAVH